PDIEPPLHDVARPKTVAVRREIRLCLEVIRGKVIARRKGLPRTPQDGHPYRGIPIALMQPFEELPTQRIVQSVSLFRAVQREPTHACPGFIDEHELPLRHGTLLQPAERAMGCTLAKHLECRIRRGERPLRPRWETAAPHQIPGKRRLLTRAA